jgi:hypothetical protein
MRGSALGVVALWLVFVAASIAPRAASSQTPATRSFPEISAISAHKSVLDQYCVTCHNQRLKTGGLSLDLLDLANVPANAEAWEKVVRKLRLGVMPPQGVRRPDRASYDSLIGWLEETLDSAAATHPNPGLPVLHRMNRAEYANAIRDLLGLDVDVTSLLPPDDAAYGFDNVADALGTSPALLQAYLAAARKISTVAVGDPRIRPGSDTYSVRQDLSQDQHLEGLPLGTLGGLVARHLFPVDGDYDFQVRLYRTNLSAIRGLQDPHQVELTLDGKRLLLASVGGDADLVPLQQNPTDTSDAIEAKRLRIRVFVKAGQREVSAAFLGETPSLFETSRLQPFIRDFGSPYAAEGAPHVQSITIQGPYDAKASAKISAKVSANASANAPSPRVFVCAPSPDGLRRASPAPASAAVTAGKRGAASIETACARQIISTLARRAYRRPVSKAEIAGLLSFYQQERSSGSFETAIEFSLRRILASPSCFVPRMSPRTCRPGRHTGSRASSWPRACPSFSGAAFLMKSSCGWPVTEGLASPRCWPGKRGACWPTRGLMPS